MGRSKRIGFKTEEEIEEEELDEDEGGGGLGRIEVSDDSQFELTFEVMVAQQVHIGYRGSEKFGAMLLECTERMASHFNSTAPGQEGIADVGSDAMPILEEKKKRTTRQKKAQGDN